MAELRFDKRDKEMASYELSYKDVFHMGNLYNGMYEWFKNNGYKSADGGEAEQLYFEIVSPQGGSSHHIWWRLVKEVHQYYRIFFKVDISTINMQEVEVMWNNQKVKTNKGDITLRVNVYLQWDPNDIIKNHWFLKHFEKNLQNKTFENINKSSAGALDGDAEGFREYVKQYLQLKGQKQDQRLFHYENKGLGD